MKVVEVESRTISMSALRKPIVIAGTEQYHGTRRRWIHNLHMLSSAEIASWSIDR